MALDRIAARRNPRWRGQMARGTGHPVPRPQQRECAMTYDVIVVGIGGMGSATAWQLARRGQRVLGLERFDIPHAMGSSDGVTRIIRLPYYEDPAYVPLLHRAYALWRELEAATGEQVLITHGSLDGGLEDGEVFNGALASARLHALPHEVLTGAEVNARHPGYNLAPQ